MSLLLSRPRGALALLLAVATIVAGCAPSPSPSIRISDFRLGPAPPKAQTRAGYLRVANTGRRARTLTRASSNAWEIVEFHRTEIVDEVSTMRRESEVIIPPGDEVIFEPFGRHLMLMVPAPPPDDAPTIVTLCFADGECIELTEGQ